MAQNTSRISKSGKKKDFLDSLGLGDGNADREHIFKAMMLEAREGFHRLINDRNNLNMHCEENESLQPPYPGRALTETAIYREIRNIYQSASRETRPYYDKGEYMEGMNIENWVLRWTIWHVMRNADSATHRQARTEAKISHEASDSQSPTSTPHSPSVYWDPVRNLGSYTSEEPTDQSPEPIGRTFEKSDAN